MEHREQMNEAPLLASGWDPGSLTGAPPLASLPLAELVSVAAVAAGLGLRRSQRWLSGMGRELFEPGTDVGDSSPPGGHQAPAGTGLHQAARRQPWHTLGTAFSSLALHTVTVTSCRLHFLASTSPEDDGRSCVSRQTGSVMTGFFWRSKTGQGILQGKCGHLPHSYHEWVILRTVQQLWSCLLKSSGGWISHLDTSKEIFRTVLGKARCQHKLMPPGEEVRLNIQNWGCWKYNTCLHWLPVAFFIKRHIFHYPYDRAQMCKCSFISILVVLT